MLVAGEIDSERLIHVGNISLLREPFVAADETNWVAAHEYVNHFFIDKLNSMNKFSIKQLINFIRAIIQN